MHLQELDICVVSRRMTRKRELFGLSVASDFVRQGPLPLPFASRRDLKTRKAMTMTANVDYSFFIDDCKPYFVYLSSLALFLQHYFARML